MHRRGDARALAPTRCCSRLRKRDLRRALTRRLLASSVAPLSALFVTALRSVRQCSQEGRESAWIVAAPGSRKRWFPPMELRVPISPLVERDPSLYTHLRSFIALAYRLR
jgi:hypothetical protein